MSFISSGLTDGENDPLPWIAGIQCPSFVDGPGVRTVVTLLGCPLECLWCQYPSSRKPIPETVVDRSRCLGCGDCERDLPCYARARRPGGFRLEPRALASRLLEDSSWWRAQGGRGAGGVTFSGGEPLVHARYLGSVVGILADTGVHVALETSLAVRVPESEALPEGLLSLASRVPLWLVDLKHPEAAEYRRVTGVSQSILTDNLALLRRAGAEVIPRLVLVPGVTDTDSSLSALSLLCADAGFSRVEFLPYNPPPGADALGLPVTGTDSVAFERARRLLEHRE